MESKWKFNLFGILIPGLLIMVLAVTLGGCTSSADKVSDNLGKEAEKFNIQRRIVGINGITDKVEFEVEGKCSIEGDGLGTLHALTVICKHGPSDYRKHFIGMSDNIFFISTQVKGVKVSEYRTKIIIKPQNIVPDLDLVTG